MNTITKIILLLVLHLFCVTTLQAQLFDEQTKQKHHESFGYHIPQSNPAFESLPVDPFHPKARTIRDEIIKPSKAVSYCPESGTSFENPYQKIDYFYDTKGKLVKEITEYPQHNRIDITTYSDKFPEKRIDTATTYQKNNMVPMNRLYFEYEIEREEAPYIAQITQKWNKSKDRWDNQDKATYTYLDTASWYRIALELYGSNTNNDFILRYKETDSLIYDENNNVVQVINKRTDMVYTAKTIYEYYYPANAHDNIMGYDSIYIYNYDENSEFYSAGKQTDITWHRWDGFDYKSNLMASFYGWNTWHGSPEGEWTLWGQQKYWYEIDGIADSWADTIYFYSDMYEHWYTKATESKTYNEQGDLCVDRSIAWKELDLTGGVLEWEWYNIDSFANEYNKDGLLWRYSEYYTSLHLDCFEKLYEIWEVTEFVDVTNDISELPQDGENSIFIFPNPVSGMVIIATESEIDQLSIFDITGRLIANPLPTGERVVFDTGALPQGVYLVRALLRDGEVRRGKIVVAR